MEELYRSIVRRRVPLLALGLVLTLVAAYLGSTLKLYDDPNRWPPDDDPAVQLNDRLQRQFGGANLVTIMITRRDGGSVIDAPTLAKVKRITDQLLEVHGVIPYAVRSLSTINARYLKGTAEVLDASVLFEDANRAPETPGEIERVRFGIHNNAALGGLLVSKDEKAVIIQADFRTGLQNVAAGLELPTTDPISIYQEVTAIITPEDDDTHEVTAAGSPILIGWVNSDGLPYMAIAFALVLSGVALVLVFAFRSEVGVLPPLLVGVVASIWAFGLQRLLGGDVLTSSSALLAPFIIQAVAASHSVVFIKRLLTDELTEGRTREDALVRTQSQLIAPMLVALSTDLIAFVVLAFVAFDNVRVLGQVTAFGLVAVVALVPLLLVPLLGLFPTSRVEAAARTAQRRRAEGSGIIYRSTAFILRPLVYKRSWQVGVIALSALIMLLSLSLWFPIRLPGDSALSRFLATQIEVGQDNTYAVHNYLTRSWESNHLYQQEMKIKERFGAVYAMSMLLAEGTEPGAVKTPEALTALDGMATHLQKLPEVPAVIGLPFYIKIMNRFLNEDRDEEFRIPQGERAQMWINEALYFYTGGTPGAFDSVVDPEYSKASIQVLVTDTSPKTVKKVIAAARTYLDEHWDAEALDGVTVTLAAGAVGIADAFNRSIAKWFVLATALSAAASYVVAAMILRSLIGPLLLMFPLVLGTIVWVFLIYLLGIEFNSNVTAALAIASGVGIDAEVYLLYRFREEYPKDGDFRRALFDAFTLVREPLVFSFAALFAGCLAVSGVPLYVGYVGFSMALVLLTTFSLSLFVAPVVWSLLQPKFLTRGLTVRKSGGGQGLRQVAGSGDKSVRDAGARKGALGSVAVESGKGD